jgi:hypothetical protein
LTTRQIQVIVVNLVITVIHGGSCAVKGSNGAGITATVPVERGGRQCRGTIGIRRIIVFGGSCSSSCCDEVGGIVVVFEFEKKRRSTGNGVRIIIVLVGV